MMSREYDPSPFPLSPLTDAAVFLRYESATMRAQAEYPGGYPLLQSDAAGDPSLLAELRAQWKRDHPRYVLWASRKQVAERALRLRSGIADAHDSFAGDWE